MKFKMNVERKRITSDDYKGKPCLNNYIEMVRRWQKQYPNKVRETVRKYYQAHKIQCNERRRKYYRLHREEILKRAHEAYLVKKSLLVETNS